MATQSDTRTLIRNAISQTDPTASDFADTELNGFIDQGVRYLGALVKKPTKRTSFQVTLGVASYAIVTYAPDLILATKAYFGDVTIPGDVKPVDIMSEEELAELSPAWLDQSTSAYGRPNTLIRDGANLLLSPSPDAANSSTGKKLYLSYVYQPAAGSDAVALDLPIVYHDLVKDYAVYLCYAGKLNDMKLGLAIKAQLEIDAKKLQPNITKESDSLGFSWGNDVDPEDYSFTAIVP